MFFERFFKHIFFLDRMLKMQFNKWGDSGLVEDKSGLIGQPANLQLQRVHMNVSRLQNKLGISNYKKQAFLSPKALSFAKDKYIRLMGYCWR